MILEITIFNQPIYLELEHNFEAGSWEHPEVNEYETIRIWGEDGTDLLPVLNRMNRLYKVDFYDMIDRAAARELKELN